MPIEKEGRYHLRIKERTLESWARAHIDLWTAHDMFQFCLGAKGEQREAFWTTALVRYVRAFSQVHWPAHEVVVSNLTQEQLVTHNFIRYLRDQMFSHPLGVGDNYELTASVMPDGAGRLSIVAVVPINWRIASLETELAQEFLDLTKLVRELETSGFERAKAVKLAEYQRQPMEEVLRPGMVQPATIDIWPKKTDHRFLKWMRKKESAAL